MYHGLFYAGWLFKWTPLLPAAPAKREERWGAPVRGCPRDRTHQAYVNMCNHTFIYSWILFVFVVVGGWFSLVLCAPFFVCLFLCLGLAELWPLFGICFVVGVWYHAEKVMKLCEVRYENIN